MQPSDIQTLTHRARLKNNRAFYYNLHNVKFLSLLLQSDIFFHPVFIVGYSCIIYRKDMQHGILSELEPYLVLGTLIGFVKMIPDSFFINIPIQCPCSDTVAVGGCCVHLVLSDKNEIIVVPYFSLVDNIAVGEIIGHFSVVDHLHLDHLPSTLGVMDVLPVA